VTGRGVSGVCDRKRMGESVRPPKAFVAVRAHLGKRLGPDGGATPVGGLRSGHRRGRALHATRDRGELRREAERGER